MEVISEAPKTASFIPLAEHQSTTPASFYTGPPVLHYYSDRCKVIVVENELSHAPTLANLVSKAPASSRTNGTNGDTNGDTEETSGQTVIEDIDVWVTSDKLFLYSTGLSTGLSIPYPSISLHAIQSLPHPSAFDTSSQGLYMQLISSAPPSTSQADEDEEQDSISMTIIPTASGVPAPLPASTEAPQHAGGDAAIESEDQPEQTPVQALFNALSACSNLHPDPVDDDEEMMGQEQGLEGSALYQAGLMMPGAAQGDGLPPPMPGSGGWITAENMHEFVDADGNFIDNDDAEMEDGDGEVDGNGLGPGAGSVRQRDEGVDADADDDTKWRRTE